MVFVMGLPCPILITKAPILYSTLIVSLIVTLIDPFKQGPKNPILIFKAPFSYVVQASEFRAWGLWASGCRAQGLYGI